MSIEKEVNYYVEVYHYSTNSVCEPTVCSRMKVKNKEEQELLFVFVKSNLHALSGYFIRDINFVNKNYCNIKYCVRKYETVLVEKEINIEREEF